MSRRLLSITATGSLFCNAALLLLARKRTGHPAQGLNCTAHWLKGDDAASQKKFDWAHSGTGTATNVAAILFWAALYERALGQNPALARGLLATLALGPVAWAADYKATPKRFTPGWELIFRPGDMAVIYTAMVLGMALGAYRARRRES